MSRLKNQYRLFRAALKKQSFVCWFERLRFRIKRRRNFRRQSSPVANQADWERELPSEVNFWENYVKSTEFQNRLTLERPFSPTPSQDCLFALLAQASPAKGSPLRVLDVGAGPMTTLGTLWLGGRVEVLAVDPLAGKYDELLNRKGIVPPIRTSHCEAEKLLEQFPEASFDLVFSSNALDHSYDPVMAICNMVLLSKPGGFVFLRHFENEAEKENFFGLHKWNFFERKGDMIIANRTDEVSLGEKLSGLASVSCYSILERNGIVHAVIQRLKA
jgi:SAM-dependent methyltransferase